MTETELGKMQTRTCEACGDQFHCGAAAGSCWCFNVEVSEEVRTGMRSDYIACLCPKCLPSGGPSKDLGV